MNSLLKIGYNILWGSHNAIYFWGKVTCQSQSAVGVPSPLGIRPQEHANCHHSWEHGPITRKGTVCTIKGTCTDGSMRAGNPSPGNVAGNTECVRGPRIG